MSDEIMAIHVSSQWNKAGKPDLTVSNHSRDIFLA